MSLRCVKELVDRHAPESGSVEVPIDGLQLFRAIAPVKRVPGVYPASLCVLVQGCKRVYIGAQQRTYDEGMFLCCTMPLPVEAEIPQAAPENPVLGLLLNLETPTMTQTLVATEASTLHNPVASGDSTPGLVVSRFDETFSDALYRLLMLLDDPAALQVLAASRLREVYFALIRTEAGSAIRRTFGASRDLGRALAYLHDHIREPLNIDELARVAGMSKAVFHRKFKAATALSPIQFVKAIRLNNAAALMAGGMNAAEASHRVGYSSPSQFSREFSRQYGMPPKRWISGGMQAAQPEFMQRS